LLCPPRSSPLVIGTTSRGSGWHRLAVTHTHPTHHPIEPPHHHHVPTSKVLCSIARLRRSGPPGRQNFDCARAPALTCGSCCCCRRTAWGARAGTSKQAGSRIPDLKKSSSSSSHQIVSVNLFSFSSRPYPPRQRYYNLCPAFLTFYSTVPPSFWPALACSAVPPPPPPHGEKKKTATTAATAACPRPHAATRPLFRRRQVLWVSRFSLEPEAGSTVFIIPETAPLSYRNNPPNHSHTASL
jgi:hypothetical protein